MVTALGDQRPGHVPVRPRGHPPARRPAVGRHPQAVARVEVAQRDPQALPAERDREHRGTARGPHQPSGDPPGVREQVRHVPLDAGAVDEVPRPPLGGSRPQGQPAAHPLRPVVQPRGGLLDVVDDHDVADRPGAAQCRAEPGVGTGDTTRRAVGQPPAAIRVRESTSTAGVKGAVSCATSRTTGRADPSRVSSSCRSSGTSVRVRVPVRVARKRERSCGGAGGRTRRHQAVVSPQPR